MSVYEALSGKSSHQIFLVPRAARGDKKKKKERVPGPSESRPRLYLIQRASQDIASQPCPSPLIDIADNLLLVFDTAN